MDVDFALKEIEQNQRNPNGVWTNGENLLRYRNLLSNINELFSVAQLIGNYQLKAAFFAHFSDYWNRSRAERQHFRQGTSVMRRAAINRSLTQPP